LARPPIVKTTSDPLMYSHESEDFFPRV
jgi:hypothetical protein